jgi:class 3 adenylate cyclase
MGTVFFSDIVSFTRMAANMSPENVVKLLNRYFTVMQNIIFRRGGSIDKCAGDNIMAHWGVLGNLPHCTENAVSAAVEMQTALFTFNRAEALRKDEGFTPVMLGHGIGLNTGKICAGNIGSERKIEFTVIGDAVNMSARIESVAGRGQTFIGEPTYNAIKERLFCIRMPDTPVKNVAKPLPIYSVRGIVPPPEAGQVEAPESWTGGDLFLALPATLVLPNAQRVSVMVTTLNAADGSLEMHTETFVQPAARATLEWNVPEKRSLPAVEGEVEACLPLGDGSVAVTTSSAIARRNTAVLKRAAEPGMLVFKTRVLPDFLTAIKPGLTLPSDLKSHEEMIRA